MTTAFLFTAVLLLIGIAIGCVAELMKRYWKRNRP